MLKAAIADDADSSLGLAARARDMAGGLVNAAWLLENTDAIERDPDLARKIWNIEIPVEVLVKDFSKLFGTGRVQKGPQQAASPKKSPPLSSGPPACAHDDDGHDRESCTKRLRDEHMLSMIRDAQRKKIITRPGENY